jgi:hypothetical protein
VRYHWLLDDGGGNLVAGRPVQVSTPTFVYSPGVGGAGGRVAAAIEAPEPPEFHPKEFDPAVWVKEIRTTSHNNNKVKLRDLVSDDPDDDEDINWRNGESTKTVNGVEVDLSTIVVVGDYIGAQMAAFDAEGKLTMVEQLQDAGFGDPYPPRLVVLPGQPAFTVTLTGDLPDGLEIAPESGILSGTPSAEGEFTFTVTAEDADPDPVIKTYAIGEVAMLVAVPEPGYEFTGWTERGKMLGNQETLALTVDINHSVVTNFLLATHRITTRAVADGAGTTSGGGE